MVTLSRYTAKTGITWCIKWNLTTLKHLSKTGRCPSVNQKMHYVSIFNRKSITSMLLNSILILYYSLSLIILTIRFQGCSHTFTSVSNVSTTGHTTTCKQCCSTTGCEDHQCSKYYFISRVLDSSISDHVLVLFFVYKEGRELCYGLNVNFTIYFW